MGAGEGGAVPERGGTLRVEWGRSGLVLGAQAHCSYSRKPVGYAQYKLLPTKGFPGTLSPGERPVHILSLSRWRCGPELRVTCS